MPLSWNEIKTRATQFPKEWENETSEDAEVKSFWDEFLENSLADLYDSVLMPPKLTKANW